MLGVIFPFSVSPVIPAKPVLREQESKYLPRKLVRRLVRRLVDGVFSLAFYARLQTRGPLYFPALLLPPLYFTIPIMCF